MKRLNILWIGLISVLMTACYDDYEKDYDKSSVYFASQKPLRTLVADTDMLGYIRDRSVFIGWYGLDTDAGKLLSVG